MRKHPLIAFFVLAYLLTWWIYPLLKLSPLLGIFGLFGPALAAIIVAAIDRGKGRLKALLSRAVIGGSGCRGMSSRSDFRRCSPWSPQACITCSEHRSSPGRPADDLRLVLFVLVVGEELGWRGYALPLLLKKRSPLTLRA